MDFFFVMNAIALYNQIKLANFSILLFLFTAFNKFS